MNQIRFTFCGHVSICEGDRPATFQEQDQYQETVTWYIILLNNLIKILPELILNLHTHFNFSNLLS